jgi:hypothetical protein
MALYNPYAKKRPRSDNDLSTTPSSVSTLVYRPSTSITQGTYTANSHGVTTSTGGVVRNTYQPNTRLIGSNVVSERDCISLAEPPQTNLTMKAVTTTTTTYKEHINLNVSSSSTIAKMSSKPAPFARNIEHGSIKQMANPAPNSLSAKTVVVELAVESASIAAPTQKPLPNHIQNISQGSVVNRTLSKDTAAILHAVASQDLPAVPTPAKQPVGIASLRPKSWTVTTKPMGTKCNTALTSSIEATTTMSHVSHPSSQQPYSQQQETPMDGLPNELFYTSEDVKPINDAYRLKLIQNAQLSSPLLNGWTLYPHQKKAIVRSLTMRRMILALDMGLGKTCIGVVWSMAFKRTFERLKIFVICPVSLKEEWKRTAQEKVGLQVEEETSKKKSTKKKRSNGTLSKQQVDDDDDYDEDDEDDGLKLRICSWAKIPTEVEPNVKHFVVCCDEAHSMQSTQAQRTKDILTLVKDKRYVNTERT